MLSGKALLQKKMKICDEKITLTDEKAKKLGKLQKRKFYTSLHKKKMTKNNSDNLR